MISLHYFLLSPFELNSFFVTSPCSALHLIKAACLSTGDIIYLSKGNLPVASPLRTTTPFPPAIL